MRPSVAIPEKGAPIPAGGGGGPRDGIGSLPMRAPLFSSVPSPGFPHAGPEKGGNRG